MKFPFELPAEPDFDVVGFGTNAVDFLITVPDYPQFGSKIELSDYTRAAGGEVATTLVGLQRLGMKTAYVGRFGDDAAGDFGWESLVAENVNLDFAEKIAAARTQIAFILIDEKTGERTVIWQRDAKLSYDENAAPLAAAALGKILHFTPHDALAARRLAEKARAAKTIVSIDIDNLFAGVEKLLPLVDILICSEEFPAKLFGAAAENKAALQKLKERFDAPVIGMTLGASGSLILCENEFIETAGFAVPNGCQDTTGAGDSFRSGFLYGLLSGASVEDSARAANAVAALKCRAVGARTSLPNAAELKDLLKDGN